MSTSKVLAVGTSYVELHLDNFPLQGAIPAGARLVHDSYRTVVGGGAVYFSKIARVLGLEPTFVGKRGEDPMGNALENLLTEEGIPFRFSTAPDVQTNINWNVVNDRGESIVMVAGTANPSLTYGELVKQIESLLPSSQYLHLGGVFRLTKLVPDLPDLVREAHRHHVSVSLDHGPVTNKNSESDIEAVKQAIREVDFYFPSRGEFLKTWDVTDPEDGLRKVAAHAPKTRVVLKDEHRDALTFEDGQVVRVPTFPVDRVVNPIGTGDSFNAGYLYAHSQGMNSLECVRFACATAACRISSLEQPTRQQIEELYRSRASQAQEGV